jgi:hypothetical protein
LSSFVLDASIAISWCFEEVQSPYAIAISKEIADGAEVHVRLILASFARSEGIAERHGRN